MAIALDATLLTTDMNTGGISPISVNTTAPAAANTKVIVLMSYFEGSANLITAMTIGGTAAALDKRNSNGSDRFDIWSADKAAGMATASAIVLTMTANTGGGLLIAALSFTGLVTGGFVTTSSAAGTGTAWSSGSATNTGFAVALFIGGSGNEDPTNPTTSTATSGTELPPDRYRAADGQGISTGYKIVGTVAADAITGNWSNAASTANTGALVIYAGTGAAAPTVRTNRMPRAAVYRSVR